LEIVSQAKPIHKTFAGWTENISKIRKFRDLPKNCQKYLTFIEKNLNIPIKYISVGAERSAIIEL